MDDSGYEKSMKSFSSTGYMHAYVRGGPESVVEASQREITYIKDIAFFLVLRRIVPHPVDCRIYRVT